MQPNEIEITLDVHTEAGVGFNVDRNLGGNASDEEKRQMIGAAIDRAALLFCNDIIPLPGGGFVSAEILGPSNEEIDLKEIRIYDPDM